MVIRGWVRFGYRWMDKRRMVGPRGAGAGAGITLCGVPSEGPIFALDKIDVAT